MSGHSKWANIKVRKEAQDKKRGAAFGKMAKGIMTAIRQGGGNTNIETNYLLRVAIDRAREVNMPKDNVDRLLKRFEERKASLESIVLEAYGPEMVPLIIETETDNRNRTLSEIKLILRDNGGMMASEGSVMYMFDRLGEIEIEGDIVDKDLELIDAGAWEIEGQEVLVKPEDMRNLVDKIHSMSLNISSQRIIYLPKNKVEVTEDGAEKLEDLIAALEDNEDVVNVFAAA